MNTEKYTIAEIDAIIDQRGYFRLPGICADINLYRVDGKYNLGVINLAYDERVEDWFADLNWNIFDMSDPDTEEWVNEYHDNLLQLGDTETAHMCIMENLMKKR